MGIGLLLLSALCMGLLALTRSGPFSILLVTLLTALAALFSPLARVLENEKIKSTMRMTASTFFHRFREFASRRDHAASFIASCSYSTA